MFIKTSIILNVVLLAGLSNIYNANEVDYSTMVAIPDPVTELRNYDLEYNLDVYCPQAPSEEAVECKNSYSLAHEFKSIVIKDRKSVEAYNEIFEFYECSTSNTQTLSMNLEMHCFFKGVKEDLIAEFSNIQTVEEFNALLAEINRRINETTNVAIKDMYTNLSEELQLANSAIISNESYTSDSTPYYSADYNQPTNP